VEHRAVFWIALTIGGAYYSPMRNQFLVSVVMPTYNRPYFLRTRSIPSVLRQTYTNWELIVVGDGPADRSTRKAVESIQDPRVRYAEISRPDYGGLSSQKLWHIAGAAARNHALDLARGEIVCPLDDDDEFLPNHLSDCVRALRTGTYDVVYGPVVLRNLETGAEALDSVPRASDDCNIIYHSTVAFTRKLAHLRYPCDGVQPDDFGLWKLMHGAGARFGRLTKAQSISYGETPSTRYRLSLPSLPGPDSSFQANMRQIMDSCLLSNSGPYCRRFETALSEYVGNPVVCTPSGDIALMLAFASVREKIGQGDRREVIVPSYTHPSTVNSLLWSGFVPVFCDVDRATLCITPEIVEPLLGPGVAAILPIYAHGNPYDAKGMEELANHRGIILVGDASAAFGARIGNQRAGTFGDMEVFSFSGTKVLTTGEGGAVSCRNRDYEEIVRRLGRYGITHNYECQSKGLNGKLAELPAALGLANLETFSERLDTRRKAADRYRTQLSDVRGLRLQKAFSPLAVGTEKDFPIVCESVKAARALSDCLDAYRVDTRPYYRPLHGMRPFAQFRRGDLSVTESLSDTVVCIPLYNKLRDELVDMIAGIIREHVARPYENRTVSMSAREPASAASATQL
jgi:dTDP-4-amino-4,6-dideoxygalactose transaminase